MSQRNSSKNVMLPEPRTKSLFDASLQLSPNGQLDVHLPGNIRAEEADHRLTEETLIWQYTHFNSS